AVGGRGADVARAPPGGRREHSEQRGCARGCPPRGGATHVRRLTLRTTDGGGLGHFVHEGFPPGGVPACAASWSFPSVRWSSSRSSAQGRRARAPQHSCNRSPHRPTRLTSWTPLRATTG